MKKYIGFLMAGAMLTFSSCKKESPLESLGQAGQNNSYKASLNVTLNDRNPAVGSDIIVTATTWHIKDDIDKIEFFESSVDKYTVNLELENTELNNWKAGENPIFLIADTISSKELWKSVEKSELNNYFQTVADAYVVRAIYSDFNPIDLSGADLINSLSTESFESLKSALSNGINPIDYKVIFPTAPANHVLGSQLTAAGKLNLVTNLTKSMLISNLKTATKVGQLNAQLVVRVTANGNAVSEVINEFQSKY